MSSLFNRYATPFITGLLLISLISGILLFLHLGSSGFREMHEWLSIVLILPFVLHLWKNWKPLLGYMRRAPMAIAICVSVLMAAFFLIPTDSESGGREMPPQFALAGLVMAAPLDQVAPVLGTTTEELTARLVAAGMPVSDPHATLTDIATAAGKTDFDLAAVLATGKAG